MKLNWINLFTSKKPTISQEREKALTLRRFRTLDDCSLQAYCGTFRLFISNRLSIYA